MSMCGVHLLCCWKSVFAVTTVFSWQNSVSLCPASYVTPRPKLPVTPGISWLATFAFQFPMMKRISFVCVCVCVLVLEGLVGLHRTVELQLLWHEWGKTWSWDHELLVGKLRLKLKKVGKTTRTFRYNLNQITYDYTVQVMNQEIRSGRPEYLKNYEWRFIILYKRQWPKPSQRNARRQSGCLKRSYK